MSLSVRIAAMLSALDDHFRSIFGLLNPYHCLPSLGQVQGSRTRRSSGKASNRLAQMASRTRRRRMRLDWRFQG